MVPIFLKTVFNGKVLLSLSYFILSDYHPFGTYVYLKKASVIDLLLKISMLLRIVLVDGYKFHQISFYLLSVFMCLLPFFNFSQKVQLCKVSEEKLCHDPDFKNFNAKIMLSHKRVPNHLMKCSNVTFC